MKAFKVSITAFLTAVVSADTPEEAVEIAMDTSDFGDFQMDDAGPAQEIKYEERRSYLRHADVVSDDLRAERKEAIQNPFGK